MKTFRWNKELACYACGHALNGCTETVEDGRGPKPGDISVCIKCGTAGIFDMDGLREPVEAELEDIAENPLIQAMMCYIKERNAKRIH